MAEPNANKSFWGFVWYVMNNPYKALGGMTNRDFLEMANLYALANAGAITEACTRANGELTVPAGTYTDAEFPDASGGSSSVTATNTVVAINQAYYPEEHQSA